MADVNRDGAGDFALVREQEGGAFDEGSVEIFYGATHFVPGQPGFPNPPLRLDTADIDVRRLPPGALPGDTVISGPIQVTAGDFDDDERTDIAVSQLTTAVTTGGDVVDQTDRGQVHVIWNVADLAPQIVLSDDPVDLNADDRIDMLRLEGATDGDGFGVLSRTVRMDVDRDGYDELFIGAANADAVAGTVIEQAGAVYAIYGTPRRVPLPNEAVVDVVELVNRTFTGVGDVLVNPGTGRPVVFSNDPNDDGVNDTDEYTLGDPATSNEDEAWYRFRIVGDGQPGDVLRLLPPAHEDRTVTLDGPAGYIDQFGNTVDGQNFLVGGRHDHPGIVEFDLSGLLEAFEDPDAIDQVTLALNGVIQVELFNFVEHLTVVGETLYFTAVTDKWGNELWKTDGTAAGTMLVKDIAPGSEWSSPNQLTPVGDRLFFVATENGTTWIYSTDGTDAGTVIVNEDAVGGPLGDRQLRTEFDGRLFYVAFSAGQLGLYATTDGIGTSVVLVTDEPTISFFSEMQVAGGDLYVSVFRFSQWELWRVRSGQPSQVETLSAFSNFGGTRDDLLNERAVVGDALFFAARGPQGNELYRIDTNQSLPVQAADVNPFFFDGNPHALAAVGEDLYFLGNVDSGGVEVALFRYDRNGVFEEIPLPNGRLFSDQGVISSGAASGNTYYFTFEFSDATELYAVVDTNVERLFTLTPVFEIGDLTPIDNRLAFRLGPANGESLYLTDGTERRTVEVFRPAQGGLARLVSFGGRVLLTADSQTPVAPDDLWSSDLTPSGNSRVLDIGPVEGTFEVFHPEGDGVVTGRDPRLPTVLLDSVPIVTDLASQLVTADVTDAIKAAIADGTRQMMIRIASDPVLIEFDQPDPAQGTGLRVTRRHGVWADLMDERGGVLEEDIGAMDLRNLAAGTYYLRIFNPHRAEQTSDLEFAIEIKPPIQGAFRSLTDDDLIQGGEGEDILVGNEHLDRLFGQSGNDVFLAEQVEVRDRENDETIRQPDAADRLLSNPAKIIDPLITIPDAALRTVLGAAMNVPMRGPSNDPEFALPVRATDLARLTFLEAADQGIADLTGLEYASNLATVDLRHNDVEDVSMIDPGRDEAGDPTGLELVRHLGLDGTLVRDVEPLGELLQLRVLSIADTAARARDGLYGEYFIPEPGTDFSNPEFLPIPDFTQLTRLHQRDDPTVDFPEMTSGFFGLSGLTDNFAVRWTGQLFLPIGGLIELSVESNDGARLYMDDVLVVDNGGLHASMNLVESLVTLEPGFHDLRLEYFQHTDSAGIILRYTVPGSVEGVIPADVLTTGGVSDVDALGGLANLVYLNLSNNTILDADALGNVSGLEHLDLSGNELRDVDGLSGTALIDDGQWLGGYSESGQVWEHSIEPVVDAFGGDYRFQIDDGRIGTAQWGFDGLADVEYEVFATWHAHQGQTSLAAYVVDGDGDAVSFEANQRIAPQGLDLAGRTWSKLGEVLPDRETGQIAVSLDDDMADGTVIADAILLRAVSTRLPKLERLNLENNPLSNTAHEVAVPVVTQRAQSPSFELRIDENDAPVLIGSIGPRALLNSSDAGSVGLTQSLSTTFDDPDGAWLVAGAGGSSEVLRYQGPGDDAPGAFVEVLAQTKADDATGGHELVGGAYGLDGDLYVADFARNRVQRYSGAAGVLEVSNSVLSNLSPRDLAIGELGRVYVASTQRDSVVRFDEGDLSTPTDIAVLPSATDYSLAFGPDDDSQFDLDIFVAQHGYPLFPSQGSILRFNDSGSTEGTLIAQGPTLSIPIDLAFSPSGILYVVDMATDGQSYRVASYDSSGVFIRTVVSTRPYAFSFDRRPRIEIGPDDRLYLADPNTGEVLRYDREATDVLIDTFVPAGSGHLDWASFIAFAPDALSFYVVSDTPDATGSYVEFFDGVVVGAPLGAQEPVAFTLIATDGPRNGHDFRGRSVDTTFNYHFGVPAVYGTKFDDLDQNGVQDRGEPGIENVAVFLDADGNGQPGVGRTIAAIAGAVAASDFTAEDDIIDPAGHATFTAINPSSGTPFNDTVKVKLEDGAPVFGIDFGPEWWWGVRHGGDLRVDFDVPMDRVTVEFGYQDTVSFGIGTSTVRLRAYGLYGELIALQDVAVPVNDTSVPVTIDVPAGEIMRVEATTPEDSEPVIIKSVTYGNLTGTVADEPFTRTDANGDYVLLVPEGLENEITEIVPADSFPVPPAAAPEVELFFEAEDFTRRHVGEDTNLVQQHWKIIDGTATPTTLGDGENVGAPSGQKFPNASGGRYVQVVPDVDSTYATTNEVFNGPRIEYDFQVPVEGRYQLFVRWDGHSGGSDSFYASIIGQSDGTGGG
ncbi:MAG: hypothetical protein CMJ18_26750, partial [Phycisphaeraceae bacterium]|nr:hypothetical protein [Phycisphaeraceae bacterium]